MARYSDEWLQELLSRNDIVDVLSEYLTLKKKGSNYWASCPWHSEKNPSFCVNPQKQFYHCFSCKKSGTVITFLMDHERMSFQEAVETLAERAGMEVPAAQQDRDYQKKKEYRKRLHGMMRDAALYYHGLLQAPEGKHALEYVTQRGILGQMNKFGLGYAKNSFDGVRSYLRQKGYTDKELLDAGLVRQNEKGRIYDFFRDRVIFPIQDAFGNVIAFGGRVMGEGEPKYLNTNETLLFNKRKNLYALNLVRKVRNLKRILLVEGYMDVVALASAGVKTAVASLGTALTPDQAKLLKRYVDGVYICYDGDDAGQNASLKAVDILAGQKLAVSVMVIPGGMDPDEFVKAKGVEAFYALAKKAMPGTAFKLHMLKKQFDMENGEEVVEYATQAVKQIGRLDNEIEKERYVRLVAKETGISEHALFAQMGRPAEQKRYNMPEKEIDLNQTDVDNEARLIDLLMASPASLPNIRGLSADVFQNEDYRKIFLYLEEQIKKGILPTYAEILSVFREEAQKISEKLMNVETPEGIGGREDYAELLLSRMEISRLKQRSRELLEQASRTEDRMARQELLAELSALNGEIHELENKQRVTH